MPQYYYQIKGRSPGGENKIAEWIFPPVFSGLVEAEDRTQAKALIEDEYGQAFPSRVLKKDMDKHHYLLNLRELTKEDTYLRRRFEYTPCKECGTAFRLIDKFMIPTATALATTIAPKAVNKRPNSVRCRNSGWLVKGKCPQ